MFLHVLDGAPEGARIEVNQPPGAEEDQDVVHQKVERAGDEKDLAIALGRPAHPEFVISEDDVSATVEREPEELGQDRARPGDVVAGQSQTQPSEQVDIAGHDVSQSADFGVPSFFRHRQSWRVAPTDWYLLGSCMPVRQSPSITIDR